MKIPRVALLEGMLVVSALSLAGVAGWVMWGALQPPPMRFEALAVLNSPVGKEPLYVVAEAPRRNLDGCTNGFQADIRDGRGEVTRLPVPARTVEGAVSRYALIIPEATKAGRYQMKIREVWNCGGAPEVVETAWTPIEVVR